MPFNPSVPQASDLIRKSQRDFLENFSVMNRMFDVNHYTWDFTGSDDTTSEDDRGKHRHVSFPVQGADPTTAANETAIYSKTNSSLSELYIREESDGTVSRLTKAGDWQYGLQLEAMCIITAPTKTYTTTVTNPDTQELIPDTWINIASVTPSGGAIPNIWTVAFETPITTANYFWDIAYFGELSNPGGVQRNITPQNNALYSDSVSANRIILQSRGTNNGSANGTGLKVLILKIYTVG